jgi:probable rRNA maturation factor
MSELVLVNRTRQRMPKKFITEWLKRLERELPAPERKKLKRLAITVVFLEPKEARRLNRQFRGKDYPTDVLSFAGDPTQDELGELVLCPSVLARQRVEHGLSFNLELGYMLLHGVLHLLGYEHEKGGAKARAMFRKQDRIFKVLSGDCKPQGDLLG